MMMTAGKMSVMCGEMMIASFMVARGFAMMMGRVLVMFGCFVMMLNGMLGHMSS
jgi:hypothetical protein